jgi:hypothetical protein
MKKKKRVHHHIKNRCNGGKSNPENLLYIEETKEKMIHKIFFDKDFYDIVIFILRLCKMKHYEEVNPKIKRFYKFLN